MCNTSCIVGTDCVRAVSVDPSNPSDVYVNGGTFLKIAVPVTNDIVGFQVADAVVAFQIIDFGHVWIEIPPGIAGPADVTLSFASDAGAGSVTTKRLITYRVVTEGTSWTKKTMTAARGGYPAMATTFDDRVLVAGGYTTPDVLACTNTADIFDNTTDMSTPAGNTMSTKRWTATATTVLAGTTVVAGACYSLSSCPYDSTLIDVFYPSSGRFMPSSAKLSIPRGFLRSLLLADGRVLFASDESPPFDVYDPILDTVTQVAGGVFSTLTPVTGWIARLRDGRVLVVPGGGGPNSIFDPLKGTFTPTGDSLMQYPDALLPLGNGHVLAIAGITVQNQSGTLYQSTSGVVAEYDPASQKFTPWAAALTTSRVGSTSVLARDGRVYVLGGMSGTGKLQISCANDQDIAPFTFLSSVEVLDPSKQAVMHGPALPEANLSLRSTILFDGSILAGGGTPCGSKAMSYPSVYFLQAPPDPAH
jgi:hypothetical protein